MHFEIGLIYKRKTPMRSSLHMESPVSGLPINDKNANELNQLDCATRYHKESRIASSDTLRKHRYSGLKRTQEIEV